jgi:hypothetical protein
MASDTEGTESGHTRMDVDKIWTVGVLLCGYSGAGSVKQPLEIAIDSKMKATFGDAAETDRWRARSALRQATGPVLREAYEHFVSPDPRMHAGHVLAGALLVIGHDTDGYWILEVDAHNQGTFYEAAGFHTVGSGSPAAYVAHALMKGYEPAGRSLRHLKLVAYRTVETCINTLGGQLGVGGHVDLWASEQGNAFDRASEDECAQIADGVAQWTTLERESLDQVVLDEEGGPEQPGPEPTLPEPLDVPADPPVRAES